MKFGRMIVMAAMAVLTMSGAGSAAPTRQRDWNAVISQTAQGGYLVGNPQARVKLIEYVSYTCPHCAHFETESDAPLRSTFIAGGKTSVEFRPLMRNKIDVAVTLLATCGPLTKFRANHTALLRGQDKWLHGPRQGEEQRWESDDFATSMRAIATDLKLYELMAPRGYTRPELDRCLMNRAQATKLAAQTEFAVNELKVQGTPSFIINGQLHDSHSWDGLRPRLVELTR